MAVLNFSVLVAVSVAACWYGLAIRRTDLVAVSKPLVPLTLIGLAWALDAFTTRSGIPLAAGLILICLSEVLLPRGRRPFLLGAFGYLGALLAFIVALLFSGQWSWLGLIGLLLVAALALTSGGRIERSARARDGLIGARAIAAYRVVATALATAAGLTGRPLVLLAAVLLVFASMVRGLDHFVGRRANAAVVAAVAVHLGLILLVVGASR